MAPSRVNIAREHILNLQPASIPEPGIVLQIRTGKKQALGPHESAIAKHPIKGLIFASETGLTGDEHVYRFHGGTERALHQYNANHYADWRAENPPQPELFDIGGFGENLTTTNMDEENVCVGDLYQLGEHVLLQVSEPRNPCYKLNVRFAWDRALKRIQRTGRVGWNYRVLRTGYIQTGDSISLVERPHPLWSVMNVQRVIQAPSVPLRLLEECSELEVLTDKFRGLAARRLEAASKRYTVVNITRLTPRVKQFTFTLREPLRLSNPAFAPFAFAHIRFGPDFGFARAYSIVSGDLRTFQLGVALDEHSRGGSEYLHHQLQMGDEIEMISGANPRAVADEEMCNKKQCVSHRLIIVGGIGITAFLPAITQWQQEGLSFEIHYAVRSDEDAAFTTTSKTRSSATTLPPEATHIYSKAHNQRMNLTALIPPPLTRTKIYCSGPTRLLQQCQQLTTELHYPSHMTHFENFQQSSSSSSPHSSNRGAPFTAQIHEPETGRKEILHVPAEKSLLQILKEAGFENVMSSCETGACGACRVTLCKGEVEFRSTVLMEGERKRALQSCVDRGVGRIEIEID